MKWHAVSEPELMRCWDDEFVVYNSLSGDTHLLGTAAGYILEQLQAAPSDEASLADSLCKALLAEPGRELSLHVRTILADLHKLELIKQAA
jgi:PqqD family protein of HPr-rel-A system